MDQKTKNEKIGIIVFIFTFVLVIVYSISFFFPALLPVLADKTESSIDPFEHGIWSIPVLVTNLCFLFFGIFYYKKLIPVPVKKFIRFLLDFEISRRVAAIIIIILLGGYIVFTVNELTADEGWADFPRVQDAMDQFPDVKGEGSMNYIPVKLGLVLISQEVFQNVKIVPFIGSISLLLVTYFFTLEITKKRFAGIISLIILLQSSTFQIYDTTATYSNFWILFYLGSLFFIYKKWPISPGLYIASVLSKLFTVFFLPMTFFVIFQSTIDRKKKFRLALVYGIILIVGISIMIFLIPDADRPTSSFKYTEFVGAFTPLSFQLRGDIFVILFLVPLVVGLYLASKKGISEANSIMVLLGGILLTLPFLVAFTHYEVQPYRHLAFIVFFAVGVGALLSNRANRLG